MSQLTRRAFLEQGAVAAAAGWTALGAGTSAHAIPPIGRTRPSHLKLSIAAYSYRDYLAAKPPKMNLFDFVNLAADMGLDAVEPTSYYFPPDVDSAYLNRLKLHAFLLGLDISGTAIGNNFCLPPGPKRDEQLALAQTWIDRAAELDAPVIRIFAGNVPRRARARTRRSPGPSRASRSPCRTPPRKGSRWPSRTTAGSPRRPQQILKLVKAIDAPELRREPRHRQFPRRRPLRRDRRARPVRRQRPGEDRDPSQGGQHPRKRPTWAG